MQVTANHVEYGRVVETGLTFDETIEHLTSALTSEGFGVVSDMDVRATMREKLGIDFRPYRILGVCNPALARGAIEAEPQMGLLLPCNLVVQEMGGCVIVSAIDPTAMVRFVGNEQLDVVADKAATRLKRVLDALPASSGHRVRGYRPSR